MAEINLFPASDASIDLLQKSRFDPLCQEYIATWMGNRSGIPIALSM